MLVEPVITRAETLPSRDKGPWHYLALTQRRSEMKLIQIEAPDRGHTMDPARRLDWPKTRNLCSPLQAWKNRRGRAGASPYRFPTTLS
jgi:hypothetical protein